MQFWLSVRQADWLPKLLSLPLLFIPYWLKWVAPPAPFAATYVMGFVLSGAMLLALIVWLICGMPGIKRFLQRSDRLAWAIAWALFVFWALITQTWAFVERQQPGVAQNFALQMALVGSYALMLTCAAPSPYFIIRLLVFNAVVSALIGGAQVACQCSLGLKAWGEVTLDVSRSGVSVIQSADLRWLRPYGLLPHPNVLAGIFVVGVFAAAGVVLHRSKQPTSITLRPPLWVARLQPLLPPWTWRAQTLISQATSRYQTFVSPWINRFASILPLVLCVWLLLLSFSRGAWLGTAIGALAVLAALIGRREMRRPLIGLTLLLLALGGLFISLYHPFIVARTGAGQETTEMRSLADRVVYNTIAQAAIAKAPVLGLGGGNTPWYAAYYLAVYTDYDLQGDHVHNVYLETWSDLGVIGLILFALLQGIGVIAALRMTRRTGDITRLMLMGAWLALAVIGLFDHYPWSLVMGQTLWMALLAVAMSESQASSAEVGSNEMRS